MTTIGNHMKLTAPASQRAAVREFYQHVLGCEITRRSDRADFFRFGGNAFLTVLYGDQMLSAEQQEKSIWLELKSDDPQELTAKVRAFGVKEIKTPERGRLYFQAPGGQVFRIAGTDEDLSRFER
jgi:catechol 2,3-dioxygenase-like lactoylglutathione lyase family enzyme